MCACYCVCLCVCVCAPYRAAPAPPSSAASPASLKVCDPLAALSVASASLSPEVPFIRPLDPPRAQLTAHSTAKHSTSSSLAWRKRASRGRLKLCQQRQRLRLVLRRRYRLKQPLTCSCSSQGRLTGSLVVSLHKLVWQLLAVPPMRGMCCVASTPEMPTTANERKKQKKLCTGAISFK